MLLGAKTPKGGPKSASKKEFQRLFSVSKPAQRRSFCVDPIQATHMERHYETLADFTTWTQSHAN